MPSSSHFHPHPLTSLMDYAHLRSWYLARLRKNIRGKQHARSLTPSAQIRADQLAVQDLILSNLPHSIKEPVKARDRLELRKILCAGVILCVVIGSFVFGFAASGRIIGIGLIELWFISIIPFLALLFIVQFKVTSKLNAISNALEKIVDTGESHETKVSSSADDPLARLVSAGNLMASSYYKAVEREMAIADFALDFFFALDKNGVITAVSPSSLEFCGFAETQLIGRPLKSLCAELDRSRLDNLLNSMIQTPGASSQEVPFECLWRKKNEQLVDVLLTAQYSMTEGAFFCVATDISQRKQLERMRKEVVAMVGHDLKTPLTSVSCNLDLLEMTVPEMPDRARDIVRLMQSNLTRLLEMINDLLDLSKMEAGKLTMMKEKTSVNEIWTPAIAAVSGALAPRSLHLKTEPLEVEFVADKKRLIQVMINLLGNAIKYSPDGGTITIRVEQQNERIITKVIDDGPGVPPDQRELVFERFHQVNDSNEAASGGTGLGLAICKHIVESHRGQIGVESGVGGTGSVFWFSVPRE